MSVASQRDHAHLECENRDNCGGASLTFPQSQELFNNPEHNAESEMSTTSQDGDSLFQTQITCTPTRLKRTRGRGRPYSQPALLFSSDDTSDDELPPKKLNVKEIFENHFRRKRRYRKRKTKRKKYLVPGKQVTKKKSRYSISFEQRRRRLLHKGIRFPFRTLKYLPFRLCYAYEQFVLGGFLNYVKNLKFERCLQESLKNKDMTDDLEDVDLEMRKYSYMDDDGPISPISEPGENVNCQEDETEDPDVKIVENGSFILDCRVPSKRHWQVKKKMKVQK
ncbi:TATA box-binding protein-associated factor RNA polymerase I subunit D [Mixophyes fleayi]|uniref:TATA box-binding protein-associated factor RNA polymerase I subunit D n=1 Tax=Mixophyes fleayi TaxID=3061075 RepID=UPI003F4D979A